jgi:hypothetical protein
MVREHLAAFKPIRAAWLVAISQHLSQFFGPFSLLLIEEPSQAQFFFVPSTFGDHSFPRPFLQVPFLRTLLLLWRIMCFNQHFS